MPIKNEVIDFSDLSGGKNNAFPRHAIDKNQCSESLNAIHEIIGESRAPGYKGLTTTQLFDSPIRGEFTYILDDGTEKLVVVAGLKIYTVDLANKTKTQIGTLTADGECYAVNAAGKLWIVNGTDFVKVESDLSVYRVRIIAPASGSAAAVAGGSLPVGVYGCYVAYARKNAAGQYLYSLPLSLGNVTLSTDLTIRVTVPDSTDPQVTHKVVFLTDAGGVVPYYFGEAVNSAAYVDIADTSGRNAFVLMNVVSAANQILPINPSAIYTFDDKLFVWDINERTVYWSLKTDVNPFDMERFPAQNFRTMSYTVNAVFAIGVDLCFNHIGNGISKAIGGDMSSVIKRTQKTFWFLDCKTPEGKSNVCFHKGLAIGLTNDGFRVFDGETFSEDLSFHIKPDVDGIYRGISADFLPCAIINRRANKRTEYRFSYRNIEYGTGSNNDQRVFNLDFYFDPIQSRKTWECWENGFDEMAIVDRVWYGAQSVDAGQIVSEDGKADIDCYDRTGHFQNTKFLKQFYILSKTFIDDLDAITVWGTVYALANCATDITGNVIVLDNSYAKFPFTIKGVPAVGGVLPADGAGGLPLPFVMAPQYPVGSCDPISFECRGNSVTLELSQVADDSDFFIYKVQLPRAKQIKNNMT
jgi:hypothetical protein